MDPVTALGLASSITQIADLSGNVFIQLFNYYREVKEAPERSQELRDELRAVSDLLDSLKKLIIDPSAHTVSSIPTLSKLQEPLVQFELLVKNMQGRIPQMETNRKWSFWERSRKGLERLKWPFTKEENGRLIESIGRYKGIFIWAITMYQTYGSHFVS